jgi:high-affinity Fe2+/Pb2+ permease
MAVVEQRRYPVVYGGWIGAIISLLIIVACLVLWLTNKIDAQTALLIGATNVAILLR